MFYIKKYAIVLTAIFFDVELDDIAKLFPTSLRKLGNQRKVREFESLDKKSGKCQKVLKYLKFSGNLYCSSAFIQNHNYHSL